MAPTESPAKSKRALLFLAIVLVAAAGFMLPAAKSSPDPQRTIIEASGGNLLPSFRLSGRGQRGEIEG
ncbi:MAG: hypothetical protein KF723_02415 [Rhizobiaceae bacterium]|nr:hypothetical protein [Rhizobiaceae bacterium]